MTKDNYMIQIDKAPSHWGFTNDRWLSHSYLWRVGDDVYLSFVHAAKLRGGYLRDLIKGIEADGLSVAIPTPLPLMGPVIEHYGYRMVIETQTMPDGSTNSVEVWRKP